MELEYREIRLMETKLSDTPGSFAGYGAIFGNVDHMGDAIEKGAFKATLKEWEQRGKWPPMLLQHGGGFFGGGADDMLPIGQWTEMSENQRGLRVEGQLFALNTERGQYIYEGLSSGVLDGLSIGFKTVQFINGTKPDQPDRTLTEIDLWEVSIVTFPANPKARVSTVKAMSVEELRELEEVLHDGGLSRRDGRRAVSIFKQWLQRDAGPDHRREAEEMTEEERLALQAIEAMTSRLVHCVFTK